MTATITSRDGMQQAIEQLGRLYEGMASLRRDLGPNPRNFSVLAEGHLDEIRSLQQQLDEYAGAVALDLDAAPLWLRVVGPDIEWHSAPTSILTSILDAFRKGVQSVAEVILTGGLTTRPTAALKRSADFRIVALAPGSLRVGVRLPEQEGDASVAVQQALTDYLTAAAWVGSEEPEAHLEASVPDESRRRLVLTELARLAPRSRGQVEEVELSGASVRTARVAGTITLSRRAKGRIDAALDSMAQQRVETHVGDLREIDLDKRSFVLRNIGERPNEAFQVECQFLPELLEAAKDALDKRVEITGSRTIDEARRVPPLLVTRLDILDER